MASGGGGGGWGPAGPARLFLLLIPQGLHSHTWGLHGLLDRQTFDDNRS